MTEIWSFGFGLGRLGDALGLVAHGLGRGLGGGLAALRGQPLPLRLLARCAVRGACRRTRLLDLLPADLFGALLEPVARVAQPLVLSLSRRQRCPDRRARG